MAKKYINPGVPFSADMPAGFPVGSVLEIVGMVNGCADNFEVNLHCKKGIAFHLKPRFSLNEVIRNSLVGCNWGNEERSGPMPFSRGKIFVMKIVAQPTKYSITVSDVEVFTYNYRYNDLTDISRLEVKGDVNLTYLKFN